MINVEIIISQDVRNKQVWMGANGTYTSYPMLDGHGPTQKRNRKNVSPQFGVTNIKQCLQDRTELWSS